MTTFTPRADRRPAPGFASGLRFSRRERDVAFTLTEVLVASALSVFVLAGILSVFLLLGRTGLNASAYAGMNSELRTAVERFNQDVRLAADVRWHDAHRLTLIFPPGSGSAVTYAFEPPATTAGTGRFVRQAGSGTTEVLVTSVAPDFTFLRYRLPEPGREEPPSAINDLETKQLEVRLRALRPGALAPSASQLAASARCVLRNKSVGQ